MKKNTYRPVGTNGFTHGDSGMCVSYVQADHIRFCALTARWQTSPRRYHSFLGRPRGIRVLVWLAQAARRATSTRGIAWKFF